MSRRIRGTLVFSSRLHHEGKPRGRQRARRLLLESLEARLVMSGGMDGSTATEGSLLSDSSDTMLTASSDTMLTAESVETAALPDMGLPASFNIQYNGDPSILYPGYNHYYSAPRDFSAGEAIGLEAFNNSEAIVRLGVNVYSADGKISTYLQSVQPYSRVNLGGPFSQATKVFGLPFTEPHVKWLNVTATAASPSAVTRLAFFLDRPTTAATVTISNVRLLLHIPLTQPLVDVYGQYAHDNWLGKATDAESLAEMIRRDAAATNALAHPAGRDAYGGALHSGIDFGNAVPPGGTGHFITARDTGGRWWLVTPEGNPFFSTGVAAVQPTALTQVQGRELLFPPSTPVNSQGNTDFYGRNGQQYDAEIGNGEKWEGRALKRLAGWGFNSLGNWPAERVVNGSEDAPKLPYTRTVIRNRLMPQSRSETAPQTPTLYFHNTTVPVPVFYTAAGRYAFPDVFSDAFLDYVTQKQVYAESGTNPDGSTAYTLVPAYFGGNEVERTNSDPYAIGMFVDNEIQWEGGERVENVALARSAVNLVGSRVRQEFLRDLAGRYSSAGSLMQAWEVTLEPSLPNALATPVTEIGDRQFVFPATLNAAAQADLNGLLGIYAEQYYETVHAGFKTHMPNKLYLGSRFYEAKAPRPVAEAAARHVDVMSVNLYRKPSDLAAMSWDAYASFGKPLLIGELGFIATDRGHFTGRHQQSDVASQVDRGIAYQQYMNLIASNPLFVGAHVYKYADDPITGRHDVSENLNWGLVDVLDLPHVDQVQRIASWNHALYERRLGTGPANNSPVLDTTPNPALTTIDEDDRTSYGTPVYALLGGMSDADVDGERGIAVTSLSGTANGDWQYTLDGGITWYDFRSVSPTSARLLPSSGEFSRLRFVPNANYHGTLSVGFHAWDQTQGYAGERFDISAADRRGGSTAFSEASETATLTVQSVNDAPVLDRNVQPALYNVLEDNTNPWGTPVWMLLTGVTDVDVGALRGLAITWTDAANGLWQYTLDSGTTWQSMDDVGLSSALLLPANGNVSRVRFVPNHNFDGNSSLEYFGWDQTQGVVGGRFDLSTPGATGGTTAFSLDFRRSTVTIDPVNDAPTDILLSNSGVEENLPSGAVVGMLSTIDPDSSDAFMYSLESGTGSEGNGLFSIKGNTLVTNAAFNFEQQSTYSVRIRTTDSGGLWHERTFQIFIIDVNEAPTIAAPGAQSVVADQSLVFSTSTNNAITLADPDALSAPLELSLAVPQGTLTLATTDGLTFISGANASSAFTVQGTLTALNAALQGLRYTPATAGSVQLSLTLDDLGNNGIGGPLIASAAVPINVTAVPTAIIIDHGMAGYNETGAWATSSLLGYDGSTTRYNTSTKSPSATWTPTLAPGNYAVSFYKVVASGSSTNAKVSVIANGRTTNQNMNFTTGTSGFVDLGTFYFNGSGSEHVKLTGNGVLRADAVRFTKVG
jgi:hypothetical protein